MAKFGKDPRVYQTTVKEFLKDEAGHLTGAVVEYLRPEKDPRDRPHQYGAHRL